jgi:hypothetical protein
MDRELNDREIEIAVVFDLVFDNDRHCTIKEVPILCSGALRVKKKATSENTPPSFFAQTNCGAKFIFISAIREEELRL